MPAAAAVATAAGSDADTDKCVESAWAKLKGPLLDAATEVCGLSKNYQWKSETWWCNGQVDEAIQDMCARFQSLYCHKEGRHDVGGQEGKNCLHLIPSGWQSMLSGWQSWQSLSQRKRNLSKYPQMVMVFFVSPNRWTAQTRTLLVFWTSIRARVKPLTMETIMVWSSQIKSWSCWNGRY